MISPHSCWLLPQSHSSQASKLLSAMAQLPRSPKNRPRPGVPVVETSWALRRRGSKSWEHGNTWLTTCRHQLCMCVLLCGFNSHSLTHSLSISLSLSLSPPSYTQCKESSNNMGILGHSATFQIIPIRMRHRCCRGGPPPVDLLESLLEPTLNWAQYKNRRKSEMVLSETWVLQKLMVNLYHTNN